MAHRKLDSINNLHFGEKEVHPGQTNPLRGTHISLADIDDPSTPWHTTASSSASTVAVSEAMIGEKVKKHRETILKYLDPSDPRLYTLVFRYKLDEKFGISSLSRKEKAEMLVKEIETSGKYSVFLKHLDNEQCLGHMYIAALLTGNYYGKEREIQESETLWEKILDNMPQVLNLLNVQALKPHLSQSKLITKTEADEISKTSHDKAAQLLLLILKSKGPTAHYIFVHECLAKEEEHRGHSELYLLLTGSRKRKAKKNELHLPPTKISKQQPPYLSLPKGITNRSYIEKITEIRWYISIGNYTLAEKLIEKHLSLDSGNLLEAKIAFCLEKCYCYAAHLDKTRTIVDEALKMCKQLAESGRDSDILEGRCCWMLARSHRINKNYQEAEQLLHKAFACIANYEPGEDAMFVNYVHGCNLLSSKDESSHTAAINRLKLAIVLAKDSKENYGIDIVPKCRIRLALAYIHSTVEDPIETEKIEKVSKADFLEAQRLLQNITIAQLKPKVKCSYLIAYSDLHRVAGDMTAASGYIQEALTEAANHNLSDHIHSLALKRQSFFPNIASSELRDTEPMEFTHEKDEAKRAIITEIMDQLMTDPNHIMMRYPKMFFVGPPRVGKTITRLRLCREMINISLNSEERPLPESTTLAECKQVVINIDSESGSNKWITSNNENELGQMLIRYASIQRRTSEPAITSPQEPIHDITKQVNKDSHSPPENLHNDTGAKQAASSADVDVPASSRLPEHSSKTEMIRIIEKYKSFLQQSGSSSKFAEMIESSVLVNIHDIGGQAGFLEMVPMLFHGPAGYLIFLNLEKDIQKLYSSSFTKEGTTYDLHNTTDTVESTLSQILAAIVGSQNCVQPWIQSPILADYCKKNPTAAIIGTHLDCLKNENGELDKEKFEQKQGEVMKIVNSFQQLGVIPKGCFFALDNHHGKDSDLEPLRKFILKELMGRMKNTRLPIRPTWLILSLILRKEFNTVALSECFDLGYQLGMDEDEVRLAIQYLHLVVGALMYYPEIKDSSSEINDDNQRTDRHWFENNVICSPQVVFDSISKIIIAPMQLVKSGSNQLLHDLYGKDWIERGLFSIEAVEGALETKEALHAPDDIIHPKRLVKLLEHLNLLSKIKVHNPPLPTPSELYFMPAILDCSVISDPPPPDTNTPASLFIKFKHGSTLMKYVPSGLFCSLVTKIASSGQMEIFGEEWELQPKKVSRNMISFFVGELQNTAMLITHCTHLEIRIKCEDQTVHLHEFCSQVLSTVFSVLKELYNQLEPVINFQCPCGQITTENEAKHMCKVTKKHAICCVSRNIVLKKEQIVWLGKHAPNGTNVHFNVTKTTPEGISFRWSRDDSPVEFSTPKPHMLHIQSVTEAHFGVYKCEASKNGKLLFTLYKHLYREGSSTSPKGIYSGEPSSQTIDALMLKQGLTDFQLNTELVIGDIHILAGCFTNYNGYKDVLGISKSAFADLHKYNFLEGQQGAMREVLRLWHQQDPSRATYRELLRIALKLKNYNDAENICQYIHDEIPAPK